MDGASLVVRDGPHLIGSYLPAHGPSRTHPRRQQPDRQIPHLHPRPDILRRAGRRDRGTPRRQRRREDHVPPRDHRAPSRPGGRDPDFRDREPRDAPPEWRAKIGFAAEKPQADGALRVREWYAFLADCYPTWDIPYQKDLTARLGLDASERISALSRGTAVKAAYVAAEAYRPDLLVLDEPTNGLDPVVRLDFLGLLGECFANAPARALIFSSHLLEDVEALCDRALLLRAGQLVEEIPGERLTEARSSGKLTELVAHVLRAVP